MSKSPLRKAVLAALSVSTREEVTAGGAVVAMRRTVGVAATGAVGVGALGCVGVGGLGAVGVGTLAGVDVGALGASGWQPTDARTSPKAPVRQTRSRTV